MNEKGFTAITILIASFILIAIIGGGYYLWSDQNQKLVNQEATQNQTVESQDINQIDADKNNDSIYRNSLNKYEVKYPADFPPTEDNTNSVIFGCNGTSEEGYCLPPYYISVFNSGSTKDANIHNSLAQSTIDKIYALKIGAELDKATTEEIGGKWDLPTRYKRLSDELINGEKFLIIENPKAYGGSDRRLFIKKNDKIYMLGGTYNGEEELKTFESIYTSFKFTI